MGALMDTHYQLIIINYESGKLLFDPFSVGDEGDRANVLAFSHCGTRIALGFQCGRVRIMALSFSDCQPETIREFGWDQPSVRTLHFGLGDESLICTDATGKIRVWARRRSHVQNLEGDKNTGAERFEYVFGFPCDSQESRTGPGEGPYQIHAIRQ